MGMVKENLSMLSSPLFVILHNLIKPMIWSADKTLLFLSHKYKFLHLLRWLVASVFVFLFHIVQSLPFSSKVMADYKHHHYRYGEQQQLVSSSANDRGGLGDTAIARTIYQLLSLVNSIPTSSRKYQVVRSLAEKLIDENNLEQRSDALRQVNCVVLSEAFGKTLLQLETALFDQDSSNFGPGTEPGGFGLRRVVKAAAKEWYSGKDSDGPAAEKMAAELLWLAQKMEDSGGVEMVLEKWGLAKNLGWLALAAEPRVQASLVRLTALLIKHAKNLGDEWQSEGGETEQQKQRKVKMLMTWLPLLCRASNGTDTPTLTTSEQGEIERTLENIIDNFEEAENQEKILSLWVHHFVQCSLSDWPNLHSSYVKWCKSSRELLLATG